LKSVYNIFYFASSVSTLGNWLTSIGLSLLIYDRFGAGPLALSGLFLTLPQFFLTQKVLGKLSGFDRRHLLIAINLAASVNVFILAFESHIYSFYAYLFFSALLKTLNNITSRSWLGDLAGEESSTVFRKLSGLNGLMLAISPALGALLATGYGFQMVFEIDALTFAIAAFIYFFLAPDGRTRQKQEDVVAKKSPSNLGYWLPILLMVAFCAIGTIHTSIDISYFKSIHFSDDIVGYLLSAWGAGSFLAFLTRKNFAISNSLASSGLMFAAGLSVVFLSSWMALMALALTVCGYLYSCILGLIRQEIQEATRFGASVLVWGRVETLTAIVSSALSICASIMIARVNLSCAIYLLIAIAFVFAAFAAWYRLRFKLAS
jgi:MFS family permease